MANKILAYGEVMMRLTPTKFTSNESNLYASYFGGSEANVLVALSSLGDKTEFFTKFPKNVLGEKAINHLKKHKVGTKNIIQDGEILGMYFTEPAKRAKHAKVIYNRKNAEVNNITHDEFDFETLFQDVSWFHVCGISLGISQRSCKLVLELLQYAKAHNIKTSFDFNYRPALWKIEEAIEAYKKIMPYIDVCFGNIFDIKTFLGINEKNKKEIIEKYFKLYNVSYLIHTNRKIISDNINSLNAKVYFKDNDLVESKETKTITFDVLDRIGGGDAFDGGVIHVLNQNFLNKEKALELGLKLDVLKHSINGDVLSINKKEIQKIIKKIGYDND